MVSVAIRDYLCDVPSRLKLLAIAFPEPLFFSPAPQAAQRTEPTDVFSRAACGAGACERLGSWIEVGRDGHLEVEAEAEADADAAMKCADGLE
jgi:hypothetical protein